MFLRIFDNVNKLIYNTASVSALFKEFCPRNDTVSGRKIQK